MRPASKPEAGQTTAFPGARLAACYAAFFAGLAVLMAVRLHGTSANVYSNLAQALLEGRLDVGRGLHDIALFQGRAYYPLGPAPAVVVVPAVAAFGKAVPTLLVGVTAVALTVPPLWLLVARHVPDRNQAAWWLLAAVAGTPLLLCGFSDNPYYAAHVVVTACLAWALLLALSGRAPALAGILVGIAAATRLDAAGAAVAVVLLYLVPRPGDRPGPGRAQALRVCLGLAPFVLLLAWYNAARFGNPFESGYGLQVLDRPWLAALRGQGLFSWRHLPENLYYFLVAGPVVAPGPRTAIGFPWLVPSEWGLGLLWTSPWLLLAAAARGRRAAILALGALAVLFPSLLYYGIGWIQFGYRYGIDALPLLLVLALMGAQRLAVRPRVLLLLFVIALVVNAWGDLWMMGMWGLPRANVG